MTFNAQYQPGQIHHTAWIAPGAVVVGDVTIGEACSVWFGAVLRADTTPIHIGARTNMQEGVIIHADPGYPAELGEGVTVGHGAIVHGAQVGNNVTIGMGAVLMNGASVGQDSIVGAGALLPSGKTYPPGVLILGSPGKVTRDLTDEEIAHNRFSAETYVQRSRAFMAGYKAE